MQTGSYKNIEIVPMTIVINWKIYIFTQTYIYKYP